MPAHQQPNENIPRSCSLFDASQRKTFDAHRPYVPMQAYDFDHSFRLETYTEEDVRRDNQGMIDIDDHIAGLALAKKHREIEMKLPPGYFDSVIVPVMEDVVLFLHNSANLPIPQRVAAGYYLADDLSSRLLSIDAGVSDGVLATDLYFQIIGTAKERNPDFFP